MITIIIISNFAITITITNTVTTTIVTVYE
jgi:hypothetical protein